MQLLGVSGHIIMIKKNIISNIMPRTWGFLSIYLFVPIYIYFLGVEAYGLIGFYSTLLGFITFSDMGITATINREMARLSAVKNSSFEMSNLLRTFELIYLMIALSIAVLIFILAPTISSKWLALQVLSKEEVSTTVRVMGLAISFHLAAEFYIGGLMGLQKQIRANSIRVICSIIRSGGVALIMWLMSATILAFMLWQLISNVVYCLLSRHNLWKEVSCDTITYRPKFKAQLVKNAWKYASGMASLSLIGALLLQSDKLLVSKMLPLEFLGYYTIACSLAAIPMLAAAPISAAVFPQFAGFVATDNKDYLLNIYRKSYELVGSIAVPLALFIAVFSYNIILIWTGSIAIANNSNVAASFLIAGQLMQTLTLIPYYIALAYGYLKLNLYIGVTSVLIIFPFLIFLISRYGINGGGYSWVIINILTMPPYMYLLHKKFLPGEFKRWCIIGVGRPLLISLPIILLGRYIFTLIEVSCMSYSQIAYFITAIYIFTALATILAVKDFRGLVVYNLKTILRILYAK